MAILSVGNEAANPPLWRDFMESVILAAVLATLLRLFIIQPFYIPSQSMEPTLMPDDRIIVNMLLYRFRAPQRGDIIVFHYPNDPSRDFVKRLVAFAGETVAIRDNTLLINGRRMDEPYLPHETMADFAPYKVPPGCYFVLGDNRNDSDDSRFWGPGNTPEALPGGNIIGKAFLVYWPPGRIRVLQ